MQSVSPVTSMTQSGNPAALVAPSSSHGPVGPWIFDSGASDHMSGNVSLFSRLIYTDSLPPITLADGSQMQVRGIGHSQPLRNLTLKSVLYVPGCPFNLLSVSKLTRSKLYSVL